jgi:acetyltransferase-like isoleucine patch superfamily enzyme
MRAVPALLARIRRRARLRRLNAMPGIRIAPSVYLGTGVLLQTDSDGGVFGGRIAIAERAILSDGVILATYGGFIDIGAHAYVGPYCVLYGHGGLTIGRHAMIGAHSVLVPANHGFARVDVPMNAQPLTREGIEIGEDVWIGSGCRVLDGVRIGRGAVIGAGSVVTRDVEPFGVAYGVPARVAWNRVAAVNARRADATTGGVSAP